MKNHTIVPTLLILFSAFLIVGYNKLSSNQRDAGDKSLEALQKVKASTEVGVNNATYAQLLINAKARTNNADEVLPTDELKRELDAAMDAYADAMQVWNEKAQKTYLDGFIYKDKACGSTGIALIPKYSLPTKKNFNSKGEKTAAGIVCGDGIDADIAIKLIWSAGETHLKKASELLHQ